MSDYKDIAAHADAGHIIEITSIPMRCITCEDNDETPITDA